MLKIYGARISPYVRKVLICMAEKNIPYEITEFNPLNKPENFKKISPMERMPALVNGEYCLSDSTAICAYLEKLFPDQPLYPENAEDYGKAIWLEEYADSDFSPATMPLFFNRVVAPKLFNQEINETPVQEAIKNSIPSFFDTMEREIGDKEFLIGESLTIADISIFAALPNMLYAGGEIDSERWPKFSSYIKRLANRPAFQNILVLEQGDCPTLPDYYINKIF